MSISQIHHLEAQTSKSDKKVMLQACLQMLERVYVNVPMCCQNCKYNIA